MGKFHYRKETVLSSFLKTRDGTGHGFMGQTDIVIYWCYCHLSFTNPRIKDGLLDEEEFSTSHSSIWSFITAVPSPLFRRQELGFSGHGFLGREEADIAIIIIIIICCY
jgi:hypothetical protein